MSLLDSLKRYTTVVADTGDIEAIARSIGPQDATTNPSLLLKAAQQPDYRPLVDGALARRRTGAGDEDGTDRSVHGPSRGRLRRARSSKIIPGRVSTEVDARLQLRHRRHRSRRRDASSRLYEKRRHRPRAHPDQDGQHLGRHPRRRAARARGHPLQPDAALQLRAGGRVRRSRRDADLAVRRPHLRLVQEGDAAPRSPPHEDPGVASVTRIYNYFKKFGYQTQVMGASFRKTEQIVALAGCDLLTIAPDLLEKLQDTEGESTPQLTPEAPRPATSADAPRREDLPLDAQRGRDGGREAERRHPPLLRRRAQAGAMGADRRDHGVSAAGAAARAAAAGRGAADLPAPLRLNVLPRHAGERARAPRRHRSGRNAGGVRAHVAAAEADRWFADTGVADVLRVSDRGKGCIRSSAWRTRRSPARAPARVVALAAHAPYSERPRRRGSRAELAAAHRRLRPPWRPHARGHPSLAIRRCRHRLTSSWRRDASTAVPTGRLESSGHRPPIRSRGLASERMPGAVDRRRSRMYRHFCGWAGARRRRRDAAPASSGRRGRHPPADGRPNRRAPAAPPATAEQAGRGAGLRRGRRGTASKIEQQLVNARRRSPVVSPTSSRARRRPTTPSCCAPCPASTSRRPRRATSTSPARRDRHAVDLAAGAGRRPQPLPRLLRLRRLGLPADQHRRDQQIEVMRGPASAVWGANAMNGVVNFISKTPRELHGDSATVSSAPSSAASRLRRARRA